MTNLIHIATITAAHGIKGEVKVRSFTSDPRAFANYGPLASKDGRVIEITKARPQKEEFICTLSNVTDRNSAEALRGTELFAARENLPKPKPGEFYLADIEGKEAIADGASLGKIVGFQNFGAGELVEMQSGLLVPARFIASVAETVTFVLPEGYLSPT